VLLLLNSREEKMSLLKSLVPALLAGAFFYSPAAALPGSSSAKNLGAALDPAVIQVAQEQKSKKVVVKKQVVVKRPVTVQRKVVVQKKVVYRPGYRYGVAPVGWRVYGPARPYYWQTAGCILVGNVWWCP
jgi:hypothetical protein